MSLSTTSDSFVEVNPKTVFVAAEYRIKKIGDLRDSIFERAVKDETDRYNKKFFVRIGWSKEATRDQIIDRVISSRPGILTIQSEEFNRLLSLQKASKFAIGAKAKMNLSIEDMELLDL